MARLTGLLRRFRGLAMAEDADTNWFLKPRVSHVSGVEPPGFLQSCMTKDPRCGRIVGCRVFQPTPGHVRPAIRRRTRQQVSCAGLVEPPLMAQAHHFLDENRLLLLVEARE